MCYSCSFIHSTNISERLLGDGKQLNRTHLVPALLDFTEKQLLESPWVKGPARRPGRGGSLPEYGAALSDKGPRVQCGPTPSLGSRDQKEEGLSKGLWQILTQSSTHFWGSVPLSP